MAAFDLGSWLSQAGIKPVDRLDVIAKLCDNGMDTPQALRELTDDDAKDIGLNLGQRKMILAEIKTTFLTPAPAAPVPTTPLKRPSQLTRAFMFDCISEVVVDLYCSDLIFVCLAGSPVFRSRPLLNRFLNRSN